MRKIIKLVHSKINHHNLFVGIVIGVGLGMFLFSLLSTNGGRSFGYRNMMYRNFSFDEGKTFNKKIGMMGYGGMMVSSNVSGGINSEEQFLKVMIFHQEIAVKIAEQVLTLNPSENIKNLAGNIISLQSEEIRLMKEWLSKSK